MTMFSCRLCNSPFDEGLHVNCGGECRLCMARMNDPDCVESTLNILLEENSRMKKALERIAQYDIQAWAMDAVRPNERIKKAEDK